MAYSVQPLAAASSQMLTFQALDWPLKDCVSCRSNVQVEDLHLQQSASKQQQLHRVDMPTQPPSAQRPDLSSQQDAADSAAELSGRVSLTERKRKKRRKTEGDMQSMHPADTSDRAGAGMGSNAEAATPGHLTPAHKLASATASDLPVKAECETTQGKLSRKQRRKLGLSTSDPAAGTPVPIKAEPGADGSGLQQADRTASAPRHDADLAGLSKKQRKKLRMTMPDPAVLSRMSSDTGMNSVPDSMKGCTKMGPHRASSGQALPVAGNGPLVKEEGGTGNVERRTQNGQHTTALEEVKAEAVLSPALSNGPDNDRAASSLPGSSRKKHKKSRKSESHPG